MPGPGRAPPSWCSGITAGPSPVLSPPAWLLLSSPVCRVPPALPECVSLKEGRPGCSELPLPLPRPTPSPLPCPSVPPVRPSCPAGTWLGAAADAATSRGGSLPCVTQLRLHARPKQRPACVSCVASDHNLVPWGRALDLRTAGCSVRASFQGGTLLQCPRYQKLPPACATLGSAPPPLGRMGAATFTAGPRVGRAQSGLCAA